MTTRREAILNGTARAAELHAELKLRDRLLAGDRPVDVLGAVRALDVFVLFKPLESLLGAYLPKTVQTPAMLLTTKRVDDRRVQGPGNIQDCLMGTRATCPAKEGNALGSVQECRKGFYLLRGCCCCGGLGWNEPFRDT